MAAGDNDGISLSVNIEGVRCPPNDEPCIKRQIELLRARHKKIIKDLTDQEEPNTAASIYLDSWVQNNFKNQGELVGGWQPFAYNRKYKARGRILKNGKIDTSAKLLQDTGRLRASFLPFATSKIAGIGSELAYSRTHNDGNGNRPPQRRILPLEKEVIYKLKLIFDDFVSGVIKND